MEHMTLAERVTFVAVYLFLCGVVAFAAYRVTDVAEKRQTGRSAAQHAVTYFA